MLAGCAEERRGSQMSSASELQLSPEAVSDFGGVRQVVAHFKAAPTHEARCNLLAVLLDLAVLDLNQVCMPI